MRSKLFLLLSLLGFSNCAPLEAQQMCSCPCPSPSVLPSPSASAIPSPSASPLPSPSPAPSPASGCNGPRASGKPGPNNTGPCDSTLLKPSGSIVASTPNQVIQNVAITGTVTIKAHGVIMKNFTLNANGADYGINVIGATSDSTGVSLIASNGEITNAMQAGIFGQGWTGQNLNVHNMGADATKGGWNTTLTNSWIHQIGSSPGAHADGFQVVNGQNILVQGNNFDIPSQTKIGNVTYNINSCIFMNINPSTATIANVVIQNNTLIGGNYEIYSSGPSNVSVINNIFGLINASDRSIGSQYGNIYNGTKTVKVWSGNKDVNAKPV